MKVPFLNLKRLHEPIQAELNSIVQEVVGDGWYVGGERVTRFEQEFAKYLGAPHCIGCGNGTDALELILEALGIGPDAEVIIPSFTWVSDAEAVRRVGARPVYADCGSALLSQAEHIEAKITAKTKAIIVVHLFGLPCDMEPILKLAEQYSLKVIEDCAQAHGATYKGQKVGTLGHAAAFSFYPTKNFGALGDGGAVVTNNEKLADKVRLLANHGQPKRDQHLMAGRNSRLDSLQAAILSLKLKYLDEWNSDRQRLARIYLEELKDCPIQLPSHEEGRVYHLFVIQTERRSELQEHLTKYHIETAIHYPLPIHLIEPHASGDKLTGAEKAAQQVLSLPFFPSLTEEEVGYVCERVRSF